MGYETFKKLCEENHISPTRVGLLCGVDSSTISNWKKGNYQPKAEKRQRLAEYFGVSLEYLDTGDESLRNVTTDMVEEEDPDLKELFSIAMKASPEERKQFIKIAKAIVGED